MKTANIRMRRDQVPGKIEPNLLGHFIEFMYDCIDGGMYAQLLKSRGFELPDQNGDGISDPWFGIGQNDSRGYALNKTEVMAPSYSQEIRVYHHYDGYGGIAQELVLEENQSYSGYVWLKSRDQVSYRLQVREHTGVVITSQTGWIDGGEWKQYHFSFTSGRDTAARLEVCLCSEGTLLVDQASLRPLSLPCGVWQEVMEKMKGLEIPLLRFPGGCFADCYHWQDGIGPIDLRPARENRHWGGVEENNFGTDEFIELCSYLGCEPMICINFGTGTAQEAAAWVEYCNGSADTEYGRKRAAHGHPLPYGVKYWDIGNETFASWEIGHCSAEEYAQKYEEFYSQMKAKNPDILFIACGGDGNSMDQSWNEELLKRLSDKIDILGLHTYAPMMENESQNNEDIYYAVVGGAPCKYEKTVQLTKETMTRYQKDGFQVKLGITEWNTSYHNNSLREHTLEAALFNAGMIHMFIRNCRDILLCNASDLVNGWPGGLIRSEHGKAFGTPSYYVIQAYAAEGLLEYIESACECESYHTKAVGNVTPREGVPYVDAVVCRNRDKHLVLCVINRYLEEEVAVTCELIRSDENVTVKTIYSACASDVNTKIHENIVPVVTAGKMGDLRLLPHSVNLIRVL